MHTTSPERKHRFAQSLPEKLISTKNRGNGPSAGALLAEIQETEDMISLRSPKSNQTPSPPLRISPQVTLTSTRIDVPGHQKQYTSTTLPKRYLPSAPHIPLRLSTSHQPPEKNRQGLTSPSTRGQRAWRWGALNSMLNSMESAKQKVRNAIGALISRKKGSPEEPASWNDEGYIMVGGYSESHPEPTGIHTLYIHHPEEINQVQDILRKGSSVVIMDLSKFSHDVPMLRTIMKKLKHTQDAVQGDLVGIGDSWFVATTRHISVERGSFHTKPKNPYQQSQHSPTSKPTAMDWRNFEAWNAERKNNEQIKIEKY